MTGRWLRWGDPTAAGVVVAVAVAVRLTVSLRGGGLQGIHAYDDGVYLAAATALVHGRLPYQDFLLLHPPGVVPALFPAAALGRLVDEPTGVAAGRLLWLGLAGANTLLVFVLARRFGRHAALVAGLFYAVWPSLVRADVVTRLEPLVTLALLTGWALLWSPRAATSRAVQLAAGVALGVAPTVKLWALAPAVAIVVAVGVGRSGLPAAAIRRVLLAAAGAATAVCLPFFLAAPAAMTRMVVTNQLTRPENGPSPLRRWPNVTGAQLLLPGAGDRVWIGYTLVATAVLLLLLAAAWWRVDRRRDARVAVLLFAVPLLLVVVSPSYFDFYPAFPAPALAVVLGAAVGGAIPVGASAVRRLGAVSLPAVLVVLAAVAAGTLRTPSGLPFPADRLAPAVAGARCVTSDSPITLLLLDVQGRNLSRDCPLLVDVTGLTYDRAALPPGPDGRAVPRPLNPRWQREVLAYLSAGDATMIVRARATGLSRASLEVVWSWRVLAEVEGYRVLAP